VGLLGVAGLNSSATPLRFALAMMFLLTASARWGRGRADLVRMAPPPVCVARRDRHHHRDSRNPGSAGVAASAHRSRFASPFSWPLCLPRTFVLFASGFPFSAGPPWELQSAALCNRCFSLPF
jgi:hypothetical protein